MDSEASSFNFYPIAAVSDFPSGERLFIEIAGQPLIIYSIGKEFLATANLCSHDGGELSEGELDGEEIICPRHGARFNIRTGKAMSLPAVIDIPIYPVRVNEGMLEVGIPV